VRQAYLAAIRRHPPERDPERFRLINQAYAAIESEDDRLKREIGLPGARLDSFDSPLEALAAFWKADLDPRPPGEEDFHSFLRA
jgi:hypothetical protein